MHTYEIWSSLNKGGNSKLSINIKTILIPPRGLQPVWFGQWWLHHKGRDGQYRGCYLQYGGKSSGPSQGWRHPREESGENLLPNGHSKSVLMLYRKYWDTLKIGPSESCGNFLF